MEKCGFEGAEKVLRWLSRAWLVLAVVVFTSGCPAESVDADTIATGMKAKLKLPVQVDDDTRLDDVRATAQKELAYFLTLTKTTKSTLDTTPLAKQLEANLRSGACQNPNYAKLFKGGISLRFVYQTRDQAGVIRIVMAPRDCGY